ncbi:unnamed protein product [Mytilus edulis]|uniref:SWIM-type domain-containing protein n=1 Tax=Mytilus edulis TaxID=6550 RepID=A0A8S3PWR1_MYTED|nr:unnamed protein product [Mytilus edulis]
MDVSSLKRWLECRGLKTGGNKSDLVQRCKDAVKAGKLEEIDITIDGGKWCDLKAAKTKKDPSPLYRQIPENFNYGHIYHYLLESVVMVSENGKTEDTDLSHLTSKPLTKGQQYVKSGSVSEIMDNERNHHYFIKAKVAASMRNEERIVQVTLSCLSGAVRDTSCTCPGSALGSCNHVAAVLLTLDKHCKEFEHDLIACTSKQCEWGKGQKNQKNPGQITDASYTSYKPKLLKLTEFDPRPTDLRKASDVNMNSFSNNLKYDYVSTGKTSMWHTLIKYTYADYEISPERRGILKSQAWDFFTNIKQECCLSEKDVFMIPKTESQSESIEWKASRWFRITASTAKKANTLGNLLKSPPTDASLRKFQAYISSTVWNLSSFMYTSPDM